MILNKYDNYIFDFDGTIVTLDVDWNLLKQEVDLLCKIYNIDIKQKLNVKIDLLKSKNLSVLRVVKDYEQPDGKILYKSNNKIINFIRDSLSEYTVISNNLSSTVEKVLKELGVFEKCKKVVGIDGVLNSKPNSESFNMLENFITFGDNVYIGDRDTDELFAKNCLINFIRTKDFI